MFQRRSEEGYLRPLAGICQKTLAHGERTMLVEFRIDSGTIVPPHNHPYEQTGYLVSGALRLTVDGETLDLDAGDSWCIGADVSHRAVAREDCVAVEVFSPPRPDYLPGVE